MPTAISASRNWSPAVIGPNRDRAQRQRSAFQNPCDSGIINSGIGLTASDDDGVTVRGRPSDEGRPLLRNRDIVPAAISGGDSPGRAAAAALDSAIANAPAGVDAAAAAYRTAMESLRDEFILAVLDSVPVAELRDGARRSGLLDSYQMHAEARLGPLFLGFTSPSAALAVPGGSAPVVLGPMPPDAFQATLDAGPVRGDGALLVENDHLAGILSARVGSIEVAALASLARTPAGNPSFLAVLSAGFTPGLQLPDQPDRRDHRRRARNRPAGDRGTAEGRQRGGAAVPARCRVGGAGSVAGSRPDLRAGRRERRCRADGSACLARSGGRRLRLGRCRGAGAGAGAADRDRRRVRCDHPGRGEPAQAPRPILRGCSISPPSGRP